MSDSPHSQSSGRKRPSGQTEALNQKLVFARAAKSGIGPIGLDALVELFRLSPQPIAAVLPDGGILAFNQAFCDLIGYTEEEIASIDWSMDLTEPVWREREAAALEQLIKTGQPARYEKEFVRKDGSRVPVELLAHLVAEADGSPAYYFTGIRDLTERKQSEQALRQSEEANRNLVQHAPTALYEIDFAGPSFKSANDVMCELSGYSREELLATNPFDLLDEEDRLKFAERIRMAAAGEPIDDSVEYRGKRKNGEPYWAVLHTTFNYEDGKIAGALVVAHDITERKKMEDALKEAADKYSALFDNTSDGIWMNNLDGRIVEVNDAYCRMSGYSRDEIIGMPISMLEAVETPGEIAEHIQKVIDEGGHDSFESQHRRKDGSVFDVDITALYLEREGGRMAIFARDITERKQAEREIESLARFPSENPYPVLRVTKEGVILYANEAAIPFLREGGREVGGAASAFLGGLIDEAFNSQSNTRADIERDGKTWSFVITPVTDGGDYANLYGRDVTERIQAREALRESEQRAASQAEYLKTILDTAPAIVWVAEDRECRTITGNRASDEFLRVKSGTNVSKSSREPAPVQHYRLFKDGVELLPHELPIQRVAASGKPLMDYSLDLLFDDGEWRSAEGNVMPLFDRGGNPSGSVGVFTDVTERKRAEEALLESEERFKAIATNTPDHILMQDANLRYTWVLNPQLGLTVEDMIGKTDFDILPEEDAVKITAIKRRVLDTGNPEYVSTSLAALDGSTQYFDGSYIAARDADGRVKGVIGYFTNVTERKRTEEALRESEERLRLAQEGASVGIWDLDVESGKVTLSPEAYRMYGVPPGSIKSSEDWRRLVHPEDVAGVVTQREKAVREHEPFDLEFRAVNESGGVRWINTKGRAVYDSAGKPVRVLGVNTDITLRKLMEEALRDGEERLRLAQEGASVGVWDWDTQSGGITFTPELNKIYGLAPGTIQSYDDWRPLVHPDDIDALETQRDAAIAAGKPFELEFRVFHSSGDVRWINAKGSAVYDEAGKPTRALGVNVDITERRQAAQQALLQAAALQAAANGIVITDCEGTIQWVNDAFTRLTGYRAVEAIGNNPRILKSGYQDAKFYKNLWDTILAGRVWQGEVVNKRKDGRLYNEEMTITPVRDAGGAVSRFVAIKQDITERKRAEDELRHANARIQKLLSANVIGIAEFDATKIVSANRALLDMTGYSARDVARGRVDWREITPPEYAERDNRAWREMMEHGECLPYEKEYITRDGKRVPILISGVQLTEDPVTGVFLNLDITDWKLMERELLETTHFAEHLFDSSLIGLTRSNNEGLLDANDAFLETIGYTREDFEAGLIDRQAMKPPEYAALDERAIGEMLATGEAAPYEKEYIRKDGSRVPVLIGRKLVRESPPEWVAFVLDITERKRAEEDLDRVRTEFLGEVSHELKTPLTAIKGCASMALSSATPPNQAEARELFEVVDTQANRLTDLVGNLLDMTRIEGGRLSIEPAEVDIGGIMEEARVIFEHSRYPHPLKIDLPPKLPLVRADSRRTVQVLTNLYSNAAKFSSPQTEIVVSAERVGGEVILHVRDSGMGIPSDKMPLLFQKFTQVHTMGAKGTGLGLFICKGIIEAQGGRIWADSAGEGRGATFSFALPAAATKRAAATKSTGAGKPAAGAGSRERRRVVAIDDEPHILRYVEHCLKTADYEVASTIDPFAAAKLVRSKDPDVVLLDMRLPGTSGLLVLEEIRKFSDVPIAFITATANREDVQRGQQFGGTTWLEKPFSREELLEHVRGILAHRRRRKRQQRGRV